MAAEGTLAAPAAAVRGAVATGPAAAARPSAAKEEDDDEEDAHDDDDDDLDGLDALFGNPPRVNWGGPGRDVEFDFSNEAGRALRDARGAAAASRVVLRVPKSPDALMAHYVWQSSMTLADRLARGLPVDVAGRNVLELGAGAALPSIAAARRGASRVLATDFPDPGIVAAMRRNVDANCGALDPGQHVAAAGFEWGAPPADVLAAFQGEPVHVVLMADTLWMERAHAALVDSLAALAGPDTRVVAAFMDHDTQGGRVARAFFAAAALRGLVEVQRESADWRPPGAVRAASGLEYGDVHIVVLERRALSAIE